MTRPINKVFWMSVVIVFSFAACNPSTPSLALPTTHATAVPLPLDSPSPASRTPLPTAGVPTPTPLPPTPAQTSSPSAPPPPEATASPTLSPFPLAAAGPYFTGKRQYILADPARKGGKLGITLWYPAIKPAGYGGTVAINAAPDLKGAPYPLLISSTTMGNEFAPQLVTHGFVYAGVDGQAPSRAWGDWLADYPREIVFMLDQIAAKAPDGLEGMIDAEKTGALGYSFDGYNALALGGARIDPKFYRQECQAAAALQPQPEEWWLHYICDMGAQWDAFAAHAGKAMTGSADGLWQPVTDHRIRAVMPMAPEGAWLFGPRGLAAIDRPVLIIAGTEDKDCPYQLEAATIYSRLTAPEHAMISFRGKEHMMLFDLDPKSRMSHFAAAFFGYYLQGREDYKKFFSEKFARQFDDLAWGPAPPE
jgi:predicted dienelactone hydrolase